MTSEETKQLKAICLVIYELVGRSDEDFLEAGIIRMGLALGQNRVRDNRSMIKALCALVTKARDMADNVMVVLEPDNQSAIIGRANDLMAEWRRGRQPLTDEAMDKALEAVGVIAENDLDIIRAKKLISLALDARTPLPEARAAASAACATIIDRGLMLGPTHE